MVVFLPFSTSRLWGAISNTLSQSQTGMVVKNAENKIFSSKGYIFTFFDLYQLRGPFFLRRMVREAWESVNILEIFQNILVFLPFPTSTNWGDIFSGTPSELWKMNTQDVRGTPIPVRKDSCRMWAPWRRGNSGRAIHHTPGRPVNSIGRLAMTRGGRIMILLQGNAARMMAGYVCSGLERIPVTAYMIPVTEKRVSV